MERKPDSDPARAAPIVPNDRENAAREWSVPPCAYHATRTVILIRRVPPKIWPGDLNKTKGGMSVKWLAQRSGADVICLQQGQPLQGRCYAP